MADVEEVEIVPGSPDDPDKRQIHKADGSFESMAMGKVDGVEQLVHFTVCGLQLGKSDIRVSDNPDAVYHEDCA